MDTGTIQFIATIVTALGTAFTGWLAYRITMTDKKMKAEAEDRRNKTTAETQDRTSLRKLEEEIRRQAKNDLTQMTRRLQNLQEELDAERAEKYHQQARADHAESLLRRQDEQTGTKREGV